MYTEFIEYQSASKAREALVRMHSGRPGNGIDTIELNYGNVLKVTFFDEPTDIVSEDAKEPVEVQDEINKRNQAADAELAAKNGGSIDAPKPGTPLTANEDGELTLPDGTVYDGPITESAPGTEPLVTTAINPTDPPAPSPATVPEDDADPVSDAPEKAANKAGAGETSTVDVSEMDRDELKAVVKSHGLKIEIKDGGPVHAQRNKVAKALAALQEEII